MVVFPTDRKPVVRVSFGANYVELKKNRVGEYTLTVLEGDAPSVFSYGVGESGLARKEYSRQENALMRRVNGYPPL